MIILYLFAVGLSCLFIGWALGKLIPKDLRDLDKTPKHLPKGGVHALDNLNEVAVLIEADTGLIIQLDVFRQSGNLKRTEIYAIRADALTAASALFKQMDEDSFRIWKNTPRSFDIRRPYGNFYGKNEGKKIWGCKLEIFRDE